MGSEKALALLRDIGAPAVPLVVARLSQGRERWRWAKLLAELGVADAPVIEALDAVLVGRKLPEPDRAWAAAALKRFAPGGAFCVLTREEVPTARAALSSPHPAIRRHAEATLLQSDLI